MPGVEVMLSFPRIVFTICAARQTKTDVRARPG